MATSVRIQVYRQGYDKCHILWLEPRWWDPHVLIGDPRFVYSDNVYDDYTAQLNKDEFLELLEKFKPNAKEELWSGEKSRAEVAMLEGAAVVAGETGRYEVVAFEWDSGL